MVSIFFFFWFLVILFGVIGAMRGWAKEILVTFSVVIALFIITLLEVYVPFFRVFIENPQAANAKYIFWIRTLLVMLLVFFGYQTPRLQRFVAGDKFNRERLQDSLLGFVLGFFNGFLIIGSILYFMHTAGYPYPNFITRPSPRKPRRPRPSGHLFAAALARHPRHLLRRGTGLHLRHHRLHLGRYSRHDPRSSDRHRWQRTLRHRPPPHGERL